MKRKAKEKRMLKQLNKILFHNDLYITLFAHFYAEKYCMLASLLPWRYSNQSNPV